MKNVRFNSLLELAGVMTGFIATILLLESEALVSWADRLDVGNGRTNAMRVTESIHRTVEPLHVDVVRRQSLAALDRLGWSDDPARLEEARLRMAGSTPTRISPCAESSAKAKTPAPIRGVATSLSTSFPAKTPLSPLPVIAGGKPRVVALVGDSMMAVGLSNVLLRDAANDPNIRVVRAFKSGTGLARPDVFDWMTEYPAMIGSERPDAVIVAIGANDGQGFVEDGKTLAFGTDAWVKVYQQRTAAFLDLLTQNGAHVVWVGLPPMRSSQYNTRIAEINRIAYTVVSQYPQATWWNPQSLIGDDAGQYREFGAMPDGKTTRLRETDGIHLSDDGAAPTLMNWLNAPPPAQTAIWKRQQTPEALIEQVSDWVAACQSAAMSLPLTSCPSDASSARDSADDHHRDGEHVGVASPLLRGKRLSLGVPRGYEGAKLVSQARNGCTYRRGRELGKVCQARRPKLLAP